MKFGSVQRRECLRSFRKMRFLSFLYNQPSLLPMVLFFRMFASPSANRERARESLWAIIRSISKKSSWKSCFIILSSHLLS